jgi:hypothetical protein
MTNGSGITQKEIEFFKKGDYAISYPGGSPAAGTLPQDPNLFSGPRFSSFFGPTGVPYSELSSGDRSFMRITDAYNLQRLFTDEAFGQYRAGLGQQQERIQQGFDEAQAHLQTAGRSARRTALEREQQLSSEMSARTGGRTYAYDYMRRGLAADTTRTLADIEESLGQLYSGLALQRTGAESGVLGLQASSYLQHADTYQDLLAQQFSLLGGYAPSSARQRDDSGLYDLAGSIAGAAGYYFGQGGSVGFQGGPGSPSGYGSGQYVDVT